MKQLNLCIDIDGTITEPYYWITRVKFWFQIEKIIKEYAKPYEALKVAL